MLRTNPAPKGVTIPGISDPLLQATARTIQVAAATADNLRHGYNASRHLLTRDDFERTLEWVQQVKAAHEANAKNPLTAMRPEQVELLTGLGAVARFKELHKRLIQSETANRTRPLFLTVEYGNFTNAAIRDCAAAIAAAYGKAPAAGKLAVGQLVAAWAEMKAVSEGSAKPSAAYAKAATSPAFTPNNVEALRVYMALGLGGLVNYGSIKTHGFTFDKVFKLPLSSHVALPDTKPYGEQPEAVQHDVLVKNTDVYEKEFADTGYDRIYVRGDDNNLYVAVHGNGALTGLQEGAEVAFVDTELQGTTDHVVRTGKVLRVVDVDNTLQEAGPGFIARSLASIGKGLTDMFRTAAEKPGATLVQVSNQIKPDKDAPPAPAQPTPWFAAVGLAGLAAALPGPHQLAAFLAIGAATVAVGSTSLSIWSMVRTGKNIVPFLDATGHNVDVKALRDDDI